MDRPHDTGSPVLEGETDDRGGSRGRRDLRDVLRHLVVVEGDRDAVSLAAVAEAAAGTDRLVPDLLTALDDESTAVRVGAAWTLCALADDQPRAVEYLAAHLAGRVDEGPFEVGQVFAYLKGRYPGRVADAVDIAVGVDGLAESTTDGHDATADRAAATDGGRSRRNDDPTGKRVETDGGVPAGTVTDLGDGRQVVRSSSGRNRGPIRPRSPASAGGANEHRGPTTPTDPPRDQPTHPDFDAHASETSDGPATRSPPDRSDTDAGVSPGQASSVEPETAPETTPDTIAAIASLSRLDRLSAVDRGVEERYAEGYRCRAERDGEERGVAVRLFERPDEDDRLAFRRDIEDRLARWEALGEVDGVVDGAEWGLRPRPWVRTRPVDASLAERGPPDAASAVDQAVALAEALAGLHARGAVHAGIDPKNVVYPCDVVGLDRPLLDNVCLMEAFRRHFEPANYLDPRFAAPEYYDDDFGTVDAATDIYGLGAVVYYLVTGRPPFHGSYEMVRRGVLTEGPPAPTDVSGRAPPRIDAVLAKALATEKLKRYDGVEPFLRELERVRDGR